MHYFAGLFDAEGWISICPKGNIIVGVQISHRKTLEDFQRAFGGKIHKGSKKTNKTVYQWDINTINNELFKFVSAIAPYCIIKKERCYLLLDFINKTRAEKRILRPEYTHKFSILKKPSPCTKEELRFEPTIKPDESFWKWMAGFMDGDGNFCVYEYQQRTKRVQYTYDSWISIFNTFSEPIIEVQKRVKGSISSYKGVNFPIWKWVCNQSSSELVCQRLEPYLIIKKEQCRLMSQYLAIHKTKIRGIDHSFENICKIQEIIKQIKHHNSL